MEFVRIEGAASSPEAFFPVQNEVVGHTVSDTGRLYRSVFLLIQIDDMCLPQVDNSKQAERYETYRGDLQCMILPPQELFDCSSAQYNQDNLKAAYGEKTMVFLLLIDQNRFFFLGRHALFEHENA